MTKKIVKKASKVAKTAKKPVKKQTNKVGKSAAKKTQENNILEDSLKVIQKLGQDVKTMAKAKEFLKDEIVKLDKRISRKESSKITNNFITKVRDEIIQDFEPIFKKINPSNIKKQIKNELIKTIELETSKIKSELSSKETKNTRVLTQKLSSLESQIMESLSNSNKIKKQFSKLKTSELNSIKEELEISIHNSITKLNKKFAKSLTQNSLEIEELRKKLSSQKSQISKIKNLTKNDLTKENENLELANKQIILIQKELKKHEKELLALAKYIDDESQVEIKDINDLSNKVNLLEKEKKSSKSELKSLKLEVENLEDKVKVIEVQNKDAISKDLSSKVSELKKSVDKQEKEKLAQKDFLVKEYNKVTKDLELIESKYEKQAKAELKILKLELESSIKKDFEEVKKSINQFDGSRENEVKQAIKQLEKTNDIFLKDIQNKYEDINNLVEKKITGTVKSYEKDKNDWDSKITKFKLEFSKFAEKHFSKVDSQLKNLESNYKELNIFENTIFKQIDKKVASELRVFDEKLEEATVKVNSLIENLEEEKRNESMYLKDRANELIDKFNKLSLENEAHLAALNIRAAKELEEKLNKSHESVTEKLAKDIVNNNEFLNKLKLENKEDKRVLAEDIETKFVTAKLQFEGSFKTHLETFDKVLQDKEKAFSNKIKDVYNEKEALLIEMTSFKDEVGILTKKYVNKLDEELQKLRTSEAHFESEKNSFFTHIDNLVQAKKLELQDYGQNIEKQIYELLKNQKESFNRNENSFREIFNEKISNLRDYQEKKLASIEKKFVDKNLKYIKEKIDSQLEYLSLFEQKLESKEKEIVKHLEILDSSKNMLHQEFTGEFNNLNEKVEERLTNAEKQFNKRFIDYDSTISQFKAVVIDEVEGLMREINQTANNKIEIFDQAIEKTENLAKSVSNNLEEIKHAKLIMDKEFSNIRYELNDLRVGFEAATHLKLGGMNNLVQSMSEYENQLIELVTSLKNKGVSNENILNALITKGHPRMYALMIINNLDSIYLK